MKSVFAALIISVLLLLSACGAQPTILTSSGAPQTAPGSELLPDETPVAELEETVTVYPVTVTDLAGYESTVASADRIISLTPSNTSILVAEGAQDRIIAVDDESAAAAPDAQVVGDYTGPDVEQIVALEPDVIFAGSRIQQETVDQLRSMGLPVIVSEATDWNQVGQSFELIGRAVNENDAAAQLTQQLQATVAEVESLAPAEQLTCYYVLSFGEQGNWTSGEGSFINEMIQFAGGVPITQGSPAAWLDYPLEDLVAADPDCILLGSDAGSYEQLSKEPGYADLAAVRNGLVFSINSAAVSQPGPNLNETLLSVSGILNAAAAGPVPTPEWYGPEASE